MLGRVRRGDHAAVAGVETIGVGANSRDRRRREINLRSGSVGVDAIGVEAGRRRSRTRRDRGLARGVDDAPAQRVEADRVVAGCGDAIDAAQHGPAPGLGQNPIALDARRHYCVVDQHAGRARAANRNPRRLYAGQVDAALRRYRRSRRRERAKDGGRSRRSRALGRHAAADEIDCAPGLAQDAEGPRSLGENRPFHRP